MKQEEEKIALRHLFETESDYAWTEREIASTLGLRGKQIHRMKSALHQLVMDGEIVPIRKGGAFSLAQRMDLVTGRLRMVRNGAGCVTDAAGKSVWCEPEDLETAMNGDLVTIRLFRKGGEDHGKVIKIVERCPHDIVGTLHTTGKFLYVVPLNPVYHKDFYVPAANNARPGDRVVVRFVKWEDPHVSPEGEIVDVIGPADKPSLDTLVVMKQFDLPEAFPDAVIDEAEQVSRRLQRPGKRLDLRDRYIFTIDPATARDFDDAISLEHDDKGRRVLGVHIADVSHFVRPGTELDNEASERGTSVYLVDRVIPMLPEQLSNGVCSLRPDEDRLTFSVFMTFDEKGNMVASSFAKSRIRSKLRLNYEQAYAALLDKPVPEGDDPVPQEAAKLIKECWQLADQLRKRRFADGALDLEVPEVEVILDAEGRMQRLETRPYDESHQLIEECMVAANEAVARELWGNGIKILTRLHEPPDPDKIEELHASLAQLGMHPGDLSHQKNLAAFLRSIADHPLRAHADMLILRSLKRAVYSSDAIGHFGLAKGFYCHFTSPIRRYPDLVVHRQLADYLEGKGGGRLPPDYLAATARETTECEQVADDASRQLIEIKKFRFLQQQLDDRRLTAYHAVVAKCTSYGVFIDIPELAMGGMVHISHLARQFVRFNPVTETLSAGTAVFRVGTKMDVVVETVDFDNRRADFVPAIPPPAPRRQTGRASLRRAKAKRDVRRSF